MAYSSGRPTPKVAPTRGDVIHDRECLSATQPHAEITHERSYGSGGNRLSISSVTKRGRFPGLSYLVHDITDVDGDSGQPA